MPTFTFYNLSDEKRKKIEKAVKKEFARVPLISMSVKNIVEEAGIARGSFYQYFETREDLIKYILEKEFEKEEENYLNILEETKDVFEATYKYLVQRVEKQEKNSSYYINIFQYLKETKLIPLKRIDISKIKNYIDMNMFNLSSDNEIYAAIRVISMITFAKKMEILNNNISKEKGLKEYKEELEITKKGLIK